MVGWQLLIEIALIGLLGAMLFHALRLERALGVVRRDRAELERLLQDFADCTQKAESGIERLRSAADGAGRHMARQIDAGANLKDDLVALIDRGERYRGPFRQSGPCQSRARGSPTAIFHGRAGAVRNIRTKGPQPG